MFRRNNKTRKYQAPAALVTHMVLERNFCQSVLFNVQVKDLENMNNPGNPLEGVGDAEGEVFYFDS
jgi:hypothetical protein